VLVTARDAAQEAAFVAQRVLELRDEGVPLAAQAVLHRAHGHALELELELARRRIRFTVRSGVRFFEQAHVKDALAYLRVVANPVDALAWHRVFSTLAGIGAKTTARLLDAVGRACTEVRSPFTSLAEPSTLATIPSRAARSVEALSSLLRPMAADPHAAPRALIRALVEDGTSFREHLDAAYPNGRARAEELLQLAELAGAHDDLGAFLSDAALVSELAGEERPAATHGHDALTLTTIHQAKGLEWRAVFVIGLAEGAFPIQGALEEDGGEAEERRLFYVAATRAMEQLYLSHPMSRALRDGDRVLLRPSRFLTELGGEVELLERWLLEE
jgi:DNA helicase-2/ATP-dependent DNA helicase PcrA